MAIEIHRTAFPGVAASDVGARIAVKLAAGSAERAVHAVASNNIEAFGITLASAARLEGVTVHDRGNTVKALCGASIGAGAEVGIASSNGALGPVAAASGAERYSIGQSVTAAAAGEVFSLYVNPKKLSGAA